MFNSDLLFLYYYRVLRDMRVIFTISIMVLSLYAAVECGLYRYYVIT
jgi:hypothetical protein